VPATKFGFRGFTLSERAHSIGNEVPGTSADMYTLRLERESSLFIWESFMSEGVFALLLAGFVVAVLVWLFWKKSP